ncbi:proline dehydrogenase family protein [Parvicella tangerina]|uniref:Proline dehydrogenase domain-containing protein n=1 Tax=Parvicella tangerina TaxID=2829795 RepID=A0A916NF92_9FLAO|nr:proline dehydrogenase family protein [Parvicella tangerina]CAG5077999.1 hypothetical protein CRYO30217_00539 [Parvicella tangerina]
MAVDFSNTEVAFKSKSDRELKKAYWLFKMVASPTVVNVGESLTNFALACRLPIRWAVKPTIFSQFCGGETIDECDLKIKQLEENNIGTILDYSLEGKNTDDSLNATTAEVLETIKKAKDTPSIPFAVFKPSGIGKFEVLEMANESEGKLIDEESKLDYSLFEERMDRIFSLGHELGVSVFVDAEDSWIQDSIDRVTERMMEKYNKDRAIVVTTVQMYRWDRLDYLRDLYQRAKEKGFKVGVKLVRGAYMEKERERAAEKGYQDPIQANKEATDRDYDLALKYCIERLDVFEVCAGSHNEKSANVLVDLLEENNIHKADNRVYFAQLLGMSDHISFNLAANGYNVAKYVPYGPVRDVMPYLIRRAQENTSVAGQTGRELKLISQELERRKKS